MHDLNNRKQLAAIFADEFHKIETDIDYREVFRPLCPNLIRYGVPFFGLSATLPPRSMEQLYNFTGIHDWEIIRMSVCRPNVAIDIKLFDTQELLLNDVVDFLKEKLRHYGEDDRAMVFCPFKELARKLAKKFSTRAYYARLGDERAINVQIFREWRDGKHRVIFTTYLLGSGTDYANVRDTLNVGFPYSMFDLQQGMDRGGRDGETCFSTTFLRKDHTVPGSAESEFDLGVSDLLEWGKRNKCLRIQPSLFFDGRASTCMTLPGTALFCGFCRQEVDLEPPRKPLEMPVFTGIKVKPVALSIPNM